MTLCARAAVVLAILAYWPQLLEQFETPKSAVVGVLGSGLLVAAVASARMTRLRTRHTPAPAPAGASWHPLDLAMGAWLLVEAAATATSAAPAVSLFGDTQQREGLLTSVGLAGLYAAVRVGTAGAERARRTLLVMMSAVAVACGVALWQLATFDAATWENAPAYLGWYRPFGSLGHANLLGVATAATLAATVGLAVSRRLGRGWWMAALALFGSVTVLTLSRAAWLGAGAGAIAALALGRLSHGRTERSKATPARRLRARAAGWAIAGAMGALALLALVEPLRSRVLELVTLGSGSGRARLEIWKAALAMWRAHPWLGAGPDTFHLLFDRHQTPGYWLVEWGASPFHAHSIYLHSLATRGVAGVLAAAGVVGVAGWALRTGFRPDASGRRLVPAVAGWLVAAAVAGSSGALGIAGAAMVACVLGVLPSLASPPPATRPRPGPATTGARAPLLAGGLVAVLVAMPVTNQMRASHAVFLAEEEGGAGAVAEARQAVALVPWSDVMAAHAADVLRRRAGRTADPIGTLAQAERYARRAIVLAPQRLYNRSELALLLLPLGGRPAPERERQAAEAIAACAELGPYNIMPLIHYAELASRLGRGDLALPVARQAAAIYPNAALPQAALGEAYLGLGDRAAARASMERALTLEWYGDRARRARVEQQLDALRAERGGASVSAPK